MAITRTKGQVEEFRCSCAKSLGCGQALPLLWLVAVAGGLVDTFDAEDAGNLADVGENCLELAAINDFEAGVNASVGTIRLAFEIADI